MAEGRSTAITVALGALLVIVVSWPWAVLPADELVGSTFGEVDNHFWAFWQARERLLGHPGPWTNLPDGWDIPLMDPVNLPWALLGWPLGPVLAYRLVALANLGLAAWGGYALARELVPAAPARVGMVATVAAPFLSGILDFGITESWPIGWLALHGAAVLRHGRTGSGASIAAASFTLACFLASGWYHATFAVVAELGLLAWALVHARAEGPIPRGRSAGLAIRLLLAAALAGATRVPALLDYLAHQELWSARFSGLSQATSLPDWRDNPTFGVDALAFVLPHPTGLPVSRTVYLGLVPILLGLLGGRRAVVPLATVLALLSLAVGHWLRIGGELGPVPLRMPAGLLVEAFPAFRGLSHWYRATGPAVVFLGAAAALGAERVLSGGAWRGWLLGGAILAESLVASPTPWPRRGYRVDPPALLAELDGGLLQLPVDDVGSPPPARSRRPYNQWQVFHGRPVAENYEGPDAVFAQSPLAAILSGMCGAPVPRGTPAALPPDPAALFARLREAGFNWIVLHPGLTRRDCRADLRAALGPPDRSSPEVVAWDVRVR